MKSVGLADIFWGALIRPGLFILVILLCVQSRALTPVQGDPRLVAQAWYLSKIRISRAWDLADSAPDVKIAVIDMDFDLRHPELKDMFDPHLSRDFSGENFLRLTSDAERVQHGTLVSALIGADGLNSVGVSGISRQSRLIALNIAPVGLPVDIEEVVRYAVDSGARVINCSFGFSSVTPEIMRKLRAALSYARQKDVLVVAAAGNYGRDSDREPHYPSALTTEFDNLISVGASTREDRPFRASNYGRRTVDLFAPGDAIIVPVGPERFDLSSGTSEASPITAGVAALIRQVNPSLTAAQVKHILSTSVDPAPALARISVSGGRLNAEKALRRAMPGRPVN